MKFIQILAAVIAFALTPLPVQADGDHPENCRTGCGNAKAPGRGTGRSVCWVTFVAPKGADALKVQIFAANGVGLLRNAQGEIAIRGGQPGTTRVSVDCSAIWKGEKAILCFLYGGKDKTFRILGEKFEEILPPSHKKGGIIFQMPPL